MKHILITIALVALPMLLSAQTENNYHKRDGKEHVKIEELVTDLTPTQRTRIDIITRRSRKTVEQASKDWQGSGTNTVTAEKTG